ncbi:hypothetical protein Adt_02935 [Abeliophyllum distichum]|uniref:Uncharacterized protein n=1 Tax=Abeliophyllum distichum TaxID=126358 RepID=A0ABD1VXB0_9LAMI
MSHDKMDRATSSRKRKSSAGLMREQQKSGPEIISASINNLVSWGHEEEDRCASSSADIPSISKCIRIVRSLPGIMRGSQLYFYVVQYMQNQQNHALFADMDTPKKKFGLLQFLFDRFS